MCSSPFLPLDGQAASAPERDLYWLAEGRGAVRRGTWKLHVSESENGLYNTR